MGQLLYPLSFFNLYQVINVLAIDFRTYHRGRFNHFLLGLMVHMARRTVRADYPRCTEMG